MMSAQSEKYWPDEFVAPARPIELLTENGFTIVRQWEWDGMPAPSAQPYHFLVSTPQGLEREIVVDVAGTLIAEIQMRTRGRVNAANSFWICCAERQLANHIAEHDECPPDNKLRIDECDSEELMMAMRWTST
ncbi:MAG: hypothetical protein ACXW18_10790 [Pyrinomonadaceae bacterium]